MNIRKTTVAALVASASIASFAAIPEVTSVTMSQASDSRLVTITYTLGEAPGVITLDVQTNATANAATDDPGWASIGGKAVWNATGDVWKKVETGSHTISWRPDLSWPDHKITDGRARAVVTAWALDNTPDYMAVDISKAATAATDKKYYPAADFVPGGVTNGLYKTTMLLMRKIMAKDVTWTMGSVMESGRTAAANDSHQVTLTNNYYIGVYPVTQTQWQGIAGFNNSQFATEKEMRPVDFVSYNEIRMAAGDTAARASDAKDWPEPPYAGSFLDKLRDKTGFDFDLPSEAQWEFAARAGNGEGRWGNGKPISITSGVDSNLDDLGRYKLNGGYIGGTVEPTAATCNATNGTAIVGSYLPNDWGLYDMFGNMREWCLDWYVADNTALNGAVNTEQTTTDRVVRGGGWKHDANYCRPAYRGQLNSTSRANNNGVRVVCTAGLQ